MFESPIIVKSGPKPNPSSLKLAMKADESADCAGSCGSFFRTVLCLYFFWGLGIEKFILKKIVFRLGPDIAILACTLGPTNLL
jgi:hypothetical protein